MSLLNGFNGQGSRPPARPAADQPQAAPGHSNAAQPNWGQPPQAAHQPAGQQPAQQWSQPSPAGYSPQSYGQPQHPSTPATHGYPAQHTPSYGGLSANPDPYAPSFEPYSAAPAPQPRAAQPAYQQPQAPQNAGHPAQGYGVPDTRGHSPYGHAAQLASQQHAPQQAAPQQWSPQPAAARGFDASSYLQQPVTAPPASQYRNPDPRHHEIEPSLSDWSQGQAGQRAQSQLHGAQHQASQHPGAQHQGYDYADPNGYNEPGFAQPAGGELEQQYAEDDGQDYELEEPSRARRPMMIAAALVGAIVVGGGLAYGYKSFLGGSATGQPPTVKSATAPSKTKPADAGGKQFAHSDSKIMGRLGEGAPAGGSATADAPASDTDANGVRKVKPLVIGRDGSIQAPAEAPAAPDTVAAVQPPAASTPPAASVSVPGMMVVDALGPRANAVAASTAAPAAQKLVVTPPPAALVPQKPVVVAKAPALPEATGSIEAPAAAVVKKPAVVAKKVAAAATNDAFTTAAAAPAAAQPVTGGASGYVAVLASLPKSASSQGDALKRYADMQQKYGGILAGKTPSVSEANLGAKGAYHRLVVGPPASREQASTVCSQLKAQGYGDCWVTSY